MAKWIIVIIIAVRFFYYENARYEILFVQFFFVYTANLIKYKNE